MKYLLAIDTICQGYTAYERCESQVVKHNTQSEAEHELFDTCLGWWEDRVEEMHELKEADASTKMEYLNLYPEINRDNAFVITDAVPHVTAKGDAHE